MSELLAGLLVGAFVGCLVVLAIRVKNLTETLDRVRYATYELTAALGGDVTDLQDSLREASIPLSHKNFDERMRRMMLTDEQRHAEAVAAFDKMMDMVRRLRDEEK
jgi:hypothetical protein